MAFIITQWCCVNAAAVRRSDSRRRRRDSNFLQPHSRSSEDHGETSTVHSPPQNPSNQRKQPVEALVLVFYQNKHLKLQEHWALKQQQYWKAVRHVCTIIVLNRNDAKSTSEFATTHCTAHKNLPKSKMKYLLQHLWLNTFETLRHSPHTSIECISDKAQGRQYFIF